jgi:heterodisulfide reductase subunit B
MNLEASQRKLSRQYGTKKVSVLYLPQLIGLALGIPEKEIKLGFNLAIEASFRKFVRLQLSELASA